MPKTGWLRPALLLLILTGVAPRIVYAQSPESGDVRAEIDALKQQLLKLEKRVEELERRPASPSSRLSDMPPEPWPGGWRDERNWSSLRANMTRHQVLQLLGEPGDKRKVNKFEYWYYGEGKVVMYLNRLDSWTAP